MATDKPERPVRVLFLTYYFPPDLSAGSFRSEALAKALSGSDRPVELDVITTSPNRYSSHRPERMSENYEGVRVRRVELPQYSPGLKGQVLSFFKYAVGARRLVRDSDYDLVVATSSRLMTGCLGAWFARRLNVPLYLDVRDIFVETIDDVFPARPLAPVRWLFARMERWLFNSASRVNLVSEGFLPYFQNRYPWYKYRFFTNGVDEVFAHQAGGLAQDLPMNRSGDIPHILYAGNIGEGQGLESILPELALRLDGRANFTVVGDGGTRQRLQERCKELGAKVKFFDPVPRSELLELYRAADVLFLHLNDLAAFRRVLPSKLFEYAASGRPVLAGVAGYASEFTKEHVIGSEIFAPCNVEAAVGAFEALELKLYDRAEFVEHFARTGIMKRMAEDILDMVPGSRASH